MGTVMSFGSLFHNDVIVRTFTHDGRGYSIKFILASYVSESRRYSLMEGNFSPSTAEFTIACRYSNDRITILSFSPETLISWIKDRVTDHSKQYAQAEPEPTLIVDSRIVKVISPASQSFMVTRDFIYVANTKLRDRFVAQTALLRTSIINGAGYVWNDHFVVRDGLRTEPDRVENGVIFFRNGLEYERFKMMPEGDKVIYCVEQLGYDSACEESCGVLWSPSLTHITVRILLMSRHPTLAHWTQSPKLFANPERTVLYFTTSLLARSFTSDGLSDDDRLAILCAVRTTAELDKLSKYDTAIGKLLKREKD